MVSGLSLLPSKLELTITQKLLADQSSIKLKVEGRNRKWFGNWKIMEQASIWGSKAEVRRKKKRPRVLHRSSSHRQETNDFYPAVLQAATGIGAGCLGGERRDTLGSKCCPPCRWQPPSREAFTPWFSTRQYIRNRMVSDMAWQYWWSRHALWTRNGGGRRGVKEWKRIPPVRDQEHPSQAPALTCLGWVSYSSSALQKPAQTSSQPSSSNLP